MLNNLTDIKPLQKELINLLEKKGALTRSQIVKELNRPRTTIYDNLVALMERNIIKKFSRQVKARGRPMTFFKLVQ